MPRYECARCATPVFRYASQTLANVYCGVACAARARGDVKLLESAARAAKAVFTCRVCRVDKPADGFHRKRGGVGRDSECIACRRVRSRAQSKIRATTNAAAFFSALLRVSRRQAPRRGLQFDITLSDVMKLWQDQRGRCALTGRDMTHIRGQGRVTSNASLDRVDPRAGYTRDNVRLVCCIVNFMRNQFSDTELVDWARAIVTFAEVERAQDSCLAT